MSSNSDLICRGGHKVAANAKLIDGWCLDCHNVRKRKDDTVSVSQAMSHRVIRRYGKYEIQESLGKGAMGEVFLATDTVLGREVAIKVILKDRYSSEEDKKEAEARFKREAMAVARLNHPNVVTIHDSGKEGDEHYIVMEYIEGIDLRKCIDKNILSRREYLELLAQVCDGLEAVHKAGLTHRDIKPENIMVIKEGERLLSKVMDFGIARPDASRLTELTKTGYALGTPSYWAPEYIRGEKPSTKNDIFSTGVVLYECLSGRKPFQADDTLQKMYRIVHTEMDSFDTGEFTDISQKVIQIIEKALKKDPVDRYQTASDVARDLRAAKDPSWSGIYVTKPESPSIIQVKDDPEKTSALRQRVGQEISAKNGNDEVVSGSATGRAKKEPDKSEGRKGRNVVKNLLVLALVGGMIYGGLELLKKRPPKNTAGSTADETAVTETEEAVKFDTDAESETTRADQAVTETAPVTIKRPPSDETDVTKVEVAVKSDEGKTTRADQEKTAPVTIKRPPSANFVLISGGTFTMGSPASEAGRLDNEAQHQVTVSSFYMGKYQVTQKEYQELMRDNPSDFRGDNNRPVERVRWFDAVEYCNSLSEREGLRPAYTISGESVTWNRSANGYRLPTEAEWEYACRAGEPTPFSTGYNITTDQANYNGNYPYNNNPKGVYRGTTTPVGSFASNRWGLYDMHGNVWEWCWDSSGTLRVIRGGCGLIHGRHVRSAYRYYHTPSNRYDYVGFRVVRPLN